jgi:hypothetical protein
MKTYNYVFLMVGLMLMFYLAGMPTTLGYVLSVFNFIDAPQDFQQGQLYQTIWILLTVTVIGGGIVIGYFTKSSPEVYLLAPFAALLLLFVGDAIDIISYTSSMGYDWLTYIVILILAPIIVGYIISVAEWWRGVD